MEAHVHRADAHAGDTTRSASAQPLRPRDAATLVVLDRSRAEPRVLMGRRSARHAFMPGKLVFPGGRTDPGDARIAVRSELEPAELAKLTGGAPGIAPSRARAIALSAVREAYEEAGLLIGRRDAFATASAAWRPFALHGVTPTLDSLRLIARATTPPGQVRRFDTRFFALWRESVALELGEGPSTELEGLEWMTIAEAKAADVPGITRMILSELETRLGFDPLLRPGGPVPYFRMVRSRHLRVLL